MRRREQAGSSEASGSKRPRRRWQRRRAALATGAARAAAAAAAALPLCATASPPASAAAVPAATTAGFIGDGKPDFYYDPSNGDLRFYFDGASITTTAGQPSFVSSLTISSASGILIPGNVSPTFAGGVPPTLTSTLLSCALINSPGFTDGFDIGLVLPAGMQSATALGDLTLKYQDFNGGSLRASDILIGGPTPPPPPPPPPPQDTYLGPSGNWLFGSNWTLGHAPSATNTVTVLGSSNGAAVTVTFDAASSTVGSLSLMASNGGAVTLAQSQGSLTVINREVVGYLGSGTVNQSGGVHSVGGDLSLGLGPNSCAVYNLSGTSQLSVAGNLVISDVESGAQPRASLNQTGSSSLAATGLVVGYSGPGTYSLSESATLTCGSFVLCSGSVTQTGGAAVVTGQLTLGSFPGDPSTYTISGGTLWAADRIVVGVSVGGAFNQSGGSASTGLLTIGSTDPGVHAAVNVSGGSLSVSGNVIVGNSALTVFGGPGSLNISGGTVTIGGQIVILPPGTNVTAVYQTGGSIAAAGVSNSYLFSQTGGSASLGAFRGTGQLSVGGGSSTAQMTVSGLSQGMVSVGAHGLLSLTPSATRATNSISALTLSDDGVLDLANHALLLDRAATSPTSIKAYLASAYGVNGDWTGPGLTSSVARSDPAKYSLAYADGADQSAEDAHISVDGGHALVEAVLTGDANMDGTVNFFDLAQLLGYKYNTGQQASYTDGDLNYDGVVDFFDLVTLLSANYNSGQSYLGAPLGAAEPGAEIVVPEPASLMAAGLGFASLVARSKRRRAECPRRTTKRPGGERLRGGWLPASVIRVAWTAATGPLAHSPA
jgi:hypothetical protein